MSSLSFTVLGSGGFVGSNLVELLDSLARRYWAPPRNEDIYDRPLGHVIYCIGLTADFRQRPFDTVNAHVIKLQEILEKAEYSSFLYLSSTRLYKAATSTHEDCLLSIDPACPDDLYNASKLMGESLCLSMRQPTVRVVRLSNVFGKDFKSNNFLTAIINEALASKKIVLGTSRDSAKDYVDVEDVVSLLLRIAEAGRHRIYNLASGTNTSNGELADALAELTGCTLEVAQDAPSLVFSSVDISRIREEFSFEPAKLMEKLPYLVSCYRKMLS